MVATQICFIFTPQIGGDDRFWRSYFSDGLVQPPTSYLHSSNTSCFQRVIKKQCVYGGRAPSQKTRWINQNPFFFEKSRGKDLPIPSLKCPKIPSIWIIFLHEWLICMVNVGKYIPHTDPMGIRQWMIGLFGTIQRRFACRAWGLIVAWFDTHRDSSRVAVFFFKGRVTMLCSTSRWWFQIFCLCSPPIWGRLPCGLIFLKWVETTTRLVYSRLAWKIGLYTSSSIVQNPVWTSWLAEKSLQVMMWSQWVVPIKVPRHG